MTEAIGNKMMTFTFWSVAEMGLPPGEGGMYLVVDNMGFWFTATFRGGHFRHNGRDLPDITHWARRHTLDLGYDPKDMHEKVRAILPLHPDERVPK
jgi:hypothetical protein